MNLSEMNPHQTMLIPLAGANVKNSSAVFLYNHLCDLYNINAFFFPKNIQSEELKDFFSACRLLKFHGSILTSPHKAPAVDYMDEIDDISRAFRSVNCIRFDPDKTVGHGFDGKGMIYAFDQKGADMKGKEVMMIGAGGVAGVFASEMAARGAKKITILNRTVEKAQYIVDELKKIYRLEASCCEFTVENAKQVAATCDVFLQATTLGRKTFEDYADLSFIDALPQSCWVMDAVSNPPETTLIQRAKARKMRTIIGMEMLVCQVEAIFDFLFNFKMDDRGRKAATDFYCKLFGYEYKK
jgi:shikimate dehydrogenase